MKKKLNINKKSIMGLSKDSKKLSKEQLKQVAGGMPRKSEMTVYNNASSWMCCDG